MQVVVQLIEWFLSCGQVQKVSGLLKTSRSRLGKMHDGHYQVVSSKLFYFKFVGLHRSVILLLILHLSSKFV